MTIAKLLPDYSLEYGKFRFYLSSAGEAVLPPYKGSAIRGVLGKAFRNIACHKKNKECEGCMFLTRCVYPYVFETSSFTALEKVGQHYVPHPFLLEPSLDGCQFYNPGDILSFDLVLFGHGLEYLPYFILAFQEVEKLGLGAGRYSFSLERVDQLKGSELIIIWQGGSNLLNPPLLENLASCLEPDPVDRKGQLKLSLETPLRLVFEGELVSDLYFYQLMRALFRRLGFLSKAHGRARLDLPFQELLERAEGVEQVESNLTWQEWERYSARQKKKLRMGGLVGTLHYQGELKDFWPFLRMGEIVHVGKGTVFGLGKIKVIHKK